MRRAGVIACWGAAAYLASGCAASSHEGAEAADASRQGQPAQEDGGTAMPPSPGQDAGSPGLPAVTDAGAAPVVDASTTGETHHILMRTCPSTRVPAEWSLMPGWVCSQVRGDPGRAECEPGIECTQQEECDATPFGRCIGYGRQSCDYGLPAEPCTSDEECTALPDGRCPPVFPPISRCYPSGECTPVGSSCHYPELSDNCEDDGDCTSLPGGHCVKAVTRATCQYNDECRRDEDCGAGRRCTCTGGDNRCVEAGCWSDDDCGAGRRCAATPTCVGFGISGYFCTTADDTCETHAECGTGYCAYDRDGSRWRCHDERCTVP